MTEIRDLARQDIPVVADLFQATFRKAGRPASPALATAMQAVLFDHPDHDGRLTSKVLATDDGGISGFMGVLPVPFELEGRRLSAAVPTGLLVKDPKSDPLAGARLVRSFFSGPQDISISEPINTAAQALWDKLGGVTQSVESMEWLRIFDPAGLAIALAGRKARIAAPLARLADRAAHKVTQRFALTPEKPRGLEAVVVDAETFAAAWPDLTQPYALRPMWEPSSLRWMLGHTAHIGSRGPLTLALVRDRQGTITGGFAYHGKPSGLAFVLQLLARPDAAGPVLDALLAHAKAAGCVAAKGRTQSRFLEPLLRRGALMFRRHTAMIHARDPALLDAVGAGRAITSGLVGEAWMRHASDDDL